MTPECNVANRTMFCSDNLDILRHINSGCIDLVYLDPPFNKNKQFSTATGENAAGASFDDIFRKDDIKAEWLRTIETECRNLHRYLTFLDDAEEGGVQKHTYAYMAYMSIRLLELRRVLKPTGSIYLHCDPTMSHYLKQAMDLIFGSRNFMSEIVWKRTSAHNNSGRFGHIDDRLLGYTREHILFYGHPIRKDDVRTNLNPEYVRKHYRHQGARGLYRHVDMRPPRGSSGYDYEFHGHAGPWRFPEATMLQMEAEDRICFPAGGGVPRSKLYLDDNKGQVPGTIWSDIAPVQGAAHENKNYPTQKPIELLKRIIRASSAEGEVVLDPFCGCATACVAAEALGRQWIGIDVSLAAFDMVKERLREEVTNQGDLLQRDIDVVCLMSPPKRTDGGVHVIACKYVYVISNPKEPGKYKVGQAVDVGKRLGSYQTGDPDRGFRVEYQHWTPYFNEIEAHIHATFSNAHEWVTGDLAAIVTAIETYTPVARVTPRSAIQGIGGTAQAEPATDAAAWCGELFA